MNLVGPEAIEAYHASQTHPKGPAIEQYMNSKLCIPAYGLGALWPALLVVRHGAYSGAQSILEKT